MLTASRSLVQSGTSAPALPYVPELDDLYAYGVTPRQGELVMISGRSGAQKSGFALWLALQFRVPTLYLSADMSPFQASTRIACSVMEMPTTEVEEAQLNGGRVWRSIQERVSRGAGHMAFKFGGITMRGIDAALGAHVEIFNAYPELIVVDNLMDTEDAQSSYEAQMDVMQDLSDLSRDTGSTVFVLHHATDKTRRTDNKPHLPPSRKEIKGGLSEKPELILTVALDPLTLDFNIAVVKQRMGKADESGATYGALTARPHVTRFEKNHHNRGAFIHHAID